MANSASPDVELILRFLSEREDHPVDLLNLLCFKDVAKYPAGHEDALAELTGRQAYRKYHIEVEPIFLELGAKLAWTAVPCQVLVGPLGPRWDAAFVGRYPSRRVLAALLTDPRYLIAEAHRTAALLDYSLIAMDPADVEMGFDTFTARE